ncbi:hypothetical protein [Phenylobacterium sp.]|uniref:hypothetical protein n=1 Tax=Phenylobacterium sp. TaxID=1871053 RepID=UPI0030F436B7
MAKRILWRWLRIALAMEAALCALMAYLGFERGTPFFRDAKTIESFAIYSILTIVAAGIVAAAEVLAGDER